MAKKGLGKGLGALIQEDLDESGSLVELKLNEIEPNAGQARKYFDDKKLEQLAESIRTHGIVQPIIVRKEADTYRIVAGERRWRAARIAGISKIPAVIKEFSNRQLMEISLIENLQREDLNPIEEAEAYERLLNEYGLTQNDIAEAIGKSRPAIANSLRLLGLGEKIKKYIIEGRLSEGHARAILTIEDANMQLKAADEILIREYSVRETEKYIKKVISGLLKKKGRKTSIDPALKEIAAELQNILSTKVTLIPSKKKGKIVIEYYSMDELDRIIELLRNKSKI
jgi:ParB family transcriptional regulator, chromosome partitioning protein